MPPSNGRSRRPSCSRLAHRIHDLQLLGWTGGLCAAGAGRVFRESLWLFLTLIGIAVGVDAVRRKSFHLKLEAQQILCQRQIEINTRK